LFVAVANSPAKRDRVIELLRESLPIAKVEVVSLADTCSDPLQEIIDKSDSISSSPLMVCDLERAIPSDEPWHPVLQSLNLRRTEWPLRLHRPTVLWVPEYLLAVLGREAPDLIDWRSDTLYFLEADDHAFQPFHTALWQSAKSISFNASERHARINELKSRMNLIKGKLNDQSTLFTYTGWLYELANQYRAVGATNKAAAGYAEALEKYKQLNNSEGFANCIASLAMIQISRGQNSEAEIMVNWARELHEKAGRSDLARLDYATLAQTRAYRGDIEAAKKYAAKVEELLEKEEDDYEKCTCYDILGTVYEKVGAFEKAELLSQRALELAKKLNLQPNWAQSLRTLGRICGHKGDLARASQFFEQAITIHQNLGDHDSLSADYGDLAITLMAEDKVDEAIATFRKAIDVSSKEDPDANLLYHYSNIADAYQAKNDLKNARMYLLKSVDLGRRLRLSHRFGKEFLTLAKSAFEEGRLNEAVRFTKEAITACATGGNIEGVEQARAMLNQCLGTSSQHAVEDEILGDLMTQAKARSTPAILQGVVLMSVLLGKEAVDTAAEVFRTRSGAFHFDPPVTLTIAMILISHGYYKFADEVLDAGFKIGKSAKVGSTCHEPFYWLNKLQIKAHQGIPFDETDMKKLAELAENEDVLTRMGAAILLRQRENAETLIRQAVNEGKLTEHARTSWPIFRLVGK
jgi:tetratricopeptide (TPR) repeat protein